MKLLKGVQAYSLDRLSPSELHNVIADAVGEPRVDTNSRRNLRKDNRVPPKTPGGKRNDGPSTKGK